MTKLSSTGPLVSIVIPFYSSYAPFFEECLESVRLQTYTNWEIVVVDDASPHVDALSLVEKWADPRVRVIRHERNRGQAAARNTGIAASKGELYMPLDCDDILANTHLEKLIRCFEQWPECNVAYADYRLFFADSGELQFPVRDTRALLREQWIPHPGTVFRRSLWEQAQGYCEDDVFRVGNEDWEFFLRAAEIGLHARRIPEPSYYYRQHANSISTTRFVYSDYITREVMYVRHQKLFDAFGMKGAFLAGGYRVSAKALWSRHEHLRAMKLLLRAAWLAPVDFVAVALRRISRYVPRWVFT